MKKWLFVLVGVAVGLLALPLVMLMDPQDDELYR